MNFFPFHIGDYAFHTRHLTLMEDLAYRRVLDLYYSRDGQLPEAGIARLIGMNDQVEEVATILGEFFPDGINKRADEEIAKMRAKQENARASVAKRTHVTQAPRERDASVIEASTTNNQEPVTKNQREKSPRKARATPLPPGFGVSERVVTWALSKGHDLIDQEAQLEAFVSYARRKGATYVDWDEALMTAIREDWAKVRKPPAGKLVGASFRERDEAAAAARHAEFTGRKPTENVIEMEPAHARLGNG